jgi:4-carboxymuconolactone decarboxylase
MTRIAALGKDELTPFQARVYDEIAGARSGTVQGPFAIWLRIPQLADKANQFGNVLRRESRLDRRLFELMVLLVARHWSAQYEWYAHERNALAVGLAPAVIEALRTRRLPNFEHDDERLTYEIVTELHETRTLSQPSYVRAREALGEEALIELITSIGFYSMLAMMINAFDAPVPGDLRPLP